MNVVPAKEAVAKGVADLELATVVPAKAGT
jgi:hypothetical protein